MAGIKHHTQTIESNNAGYAFSATAWEEEHDVDDSSIAQSKVAPDIQVIAGPEWADPTGSGPFAMQFNSGANKSRLCWYNGTVWTYVWGGNCHIQQCLLGFGTVGVRDLCYVSTSWAGTLTPKASRIDGTFTASACPGFGVALATQTVTDALFPVLVHGRMQLLAGGAIEAGMAIVGGLGAKAYQMVDQDVYESLTNNYYTYQSRRIGIALTTAGSANALFWALVNP